jgi:hypothetical protein
MIINLFHDTITLTSLNYFNQFNKFNTFKQTNNKFD